MAGRKEPVIVVTGFGAGDSAQFQNPVGRMFMKALLGRMYADKSRMEDILTATSLQWEIVRPGTLSPQGNECAGISRKDLAAFLVEGGTAVDRRPPLAVLPRDSRRIHVGS